MLRREITGIFSLSFKQCGNEAYYELWIRKLNSRKRNAHSNIRCIFKCVCKVSQRRNGICDILIFVKIECAHSIDECASPLFANMWYKYTHSLNKMQILGDISHRYCRFSTALNGPQNRCTTSSLTNRRDIFAIWIIAFRAFQKLSAVSSLQE